MLGIHKFCATDDTRPTFKFMQVRGGFVYATSEVTAIKIPAKEVFGEDIIQDDEPPFYIEGDYWRSQKFDKAFVIKREGNEFTAFSRKGLRIGFIAPLSEEKFLEDIGAFPNIDSVLPDDTKIATFNLNAKELMNISDCFSSWPLSISVGNLDRPIYSISPITFENTEAQVILSPCMGNDPETGKPFGVKIPGLNADVSDSKTEIATFLRNEIATLRAKLDEARSNASCASDNLPVVTDDNLEELERLREVNKGLMDECEEKGWAIERLKEKISDLEFKAEETKNKHIEEKDELYDEIEEAKSALKEKGYLEEYEGFYYTCENEQHRLLFNEFIDCLKEVNPMILLSQLQNIKELV